MAPIGSRRPVFSRRWICVALTTVSAPLPSERRQQPRAALRLHVRYPDDQRYLSDWTANVSAGGLFVESELPRQLGELVLLTISFPGLLRPLNVQGTVAWLRAGDEQTPSGFGLRVDSEGGRRRLADIALRAIRGHRDRSFSVVVAEDNAAIMTMLERVLSHYESVSGGAVRACLARNGHEAWELASMHPPDLVITDLYMPVLDGFELCRRLRESVELKSVPVVAVTSGSERELERIMELGVDVVLRKPFQFGQILETITVLLGRRDTDRDEQSGCEGEETPGAGDLGAL